MTKEIVIECLLKGVRRQAIGRVLRAWKRRGCGLICVRLRAWIKRISCRMGRKLTCSQLVLIDLAAGRGMTGEATYRAAGCGMAGKMPRRASTANRREGTAGQISTKRRQPHRGAPSFASCPCLGGLR